MPRPRPRTVLPALAAAFALALAALPGPQGALAQPSATPLGGVNIGGLGYRPALAEADQDIALARALHSRVVRIELPWAIVEPGASGGVDGRAQAFDDRLMADASAAGIRVIAMVRGTPCWASTAPAPVLRRCSLTHETPANAWPPRDYARFGQFAAYVAARYATTLAAIEVWNEPDQANEDYLAGPDKPRHYTALLRAAYPAVKRVNPSLPVLAGSLVGSNGAFLRALYRAGIQGYYDGLAVHFYNVTLGSIRAIHEVQLANGDSKPLWLDEFGWSSCWPRRSEQEQPCVTAAVQALNMSNVIRSLAQTPYIAAVVVFKLRDSHLEEFGVVNASGRHKPAFSALAHALAAPTGRVSQVRLALRALSGHVVVSGTAPVGDFMGMEVTLNGVLRYTALFLLDRFDRFHITLPAALGTSSLRVRVFQYWTGAATAAQGSI